MAGGAESWRRLQIVFPDGIATHCQEQEFYFGEDFLLRRHDYRVEVCGGLPAAQYVHDYVECDGLLMPSKRRAYRRDSNGRAIDSQLLVSIDVSDIRYT